MHDEYAPSIFITLCEFTHKTYFICTVDLPLWHDIRLTVVVPWTIGAENASSGCPRKRKIAEVDLAAATTGTIVTVSFHGISSKTEVRLRRPDEWFTGLYIVEYDKIKGFGNGEGNQRV